LTSSEAHGQLKIHGGALHQQPGDNDHDLRSIGRSFDVLRSEGMQKQVKTRSSPAPSGEPLVEAGATVSLVVSGASSRWHRWSPPPKLREDGLKEFWLSANLFYWCLFCGFAVLAVLLRMTVLGQLTLAGCYWSALAGWVCLAFVYNAAVWSSLGKSAGMSWLAGWILEMTFMVENLFVFGVVVKAFRLPVRLTPKALNLVAWGQILFQMVFFMGMAAWLRTLRCLPYCLGVWLIFCGVSTLFEGDGHSEDFDIMDTFLARSFKNCLGDRLLPGYDKESDRFFVSDSTASAGPKLRVSLLVPAVCALLLADFLLEIDAVLAKIEELPNSYIAFSSSALAAVTIPEMYFVSQSLLQRFSLFKYGIASVLIFFGTEMLVSNLLGMDLPPLEACLIVVGILGLSLAASVLRDCLGFSAGAADGASIHHEQAEEDRPFQGDSRLVAQPAAGSSPSLAN